MGKKENAVESLLCTGVLRLGGVCEKFESPGTVGVPDRIISWPMHADAMHGYPAWIEFVETKSDEGKVEPWQARDHARRRKMGFRVSVLWTKDQVAEFLKERGA